MRIGPNQRTPGEIKDQLVQAHRAYREGKEKLVEGAITYTEARKSKLFAPLFVTLLLMVWLGAAFWEAPAGKIFDTIGNFPKVIALVVFFISYFAFFHASRLVLKPSEEELSDDTSYFALFSACKSRERRGLLSSAFGVANTVSLVAFVIVKQTGLEPWRLF